MWIPGVNLRVKLLILALLQVLTYAQANYARFPSAKSQAPSPDGRYVVVNIDNQRQPYHSIILEEKGTGRTRKIADYERSVAVLWAPSSGLLALNEYSGSDSTSTYIIPLDESLPKIDVQKEIVSKAKHIAHGDHEYFGVMRWVDDRRVIVNHWGHGESEQGFCECYIYTLNGSVRRCAIEHSSDPEERCQKLTP